MKTLLSKLRDIPYSYLLYGPALVYAVGFIMNMIVMVANHGQMPVLIPGGWVGACPIDPDADWIHSCMMPATHFKFLADWIVMHHGVASPGDFLEWLCDATFWPALVLWCGFSIKDATAPKAGW